MLLNLFAGSYSPQPPPVSKNMGPVLELALQRAPVLHLRQGRLESALERYRATLSAVEATGTHSARLKCMKQLADLLIRRAGGEEYKAPVAVSGSKPSPWKPKQYANLNQVIKSTYLTHLALDPRNS